MISAMINRPLNARPMLPSDCRDPKIAEEVL
jgi:hypothetical protein